MLTDYLEEHGIEVDAAAADNAQVVLPKLGKLEAVLIPQDSGEEMLDLSQIRVEIDLNPATLAYILVELGEGGAWLTGVVLAVITVTFGVTGYSLPWDQVGYWAVKIVSGVPAAIPVVGDQLVTLMRGSESVGQATLTRFYSLHTFVLPWSIAVFMLLHFLMIRKQGISGPL